MTAPDPHAMRVRWIDALRDADPHKQMRGYLTHDDHHCAVGIGARALQRELGVRERDTFFSDARAPSHRIPSSQMACRLAQLLDIDRETVGWVMQLNDTVHLSFARIADKLKERIL